MINFEREELANGLRLVVNTDKSTPLVAVCVSYFVGTRDEDSEKTGFAHLFEHLMFGGSKHAPNFDDYIQSAGGENNAYTNQDMTVYYETVPRENLEVALWLEADRMADLTLNKKALAVQRKVVVEEFKETCLNEPYGDVWHYLSPLAYQTHPYQVPTIGKSIDHIKNATIEDVKSFFDRFYRPNNAVLVLSGNIELAEAKELAEKWFGDVAAGEPVSRNYPKEQPQTEARRVEVRADVPLNALYIAFVGASRGEAAYYADTLLTDVLAEGEAARLYQRLVKDESVFSEIDAYTTATIDESLVVIEAKLYDNISFEQAEAAIWRELDLLKNEPLTPREWEKLQNRVESTLIFSEISASNKAANLAYYELLGDIELINRESEAHRAVSPNVLQNRAQYLFQPQRSNTLRYYAEAKAEAKTEK